MTAPREPLFVQDTLNWCNERRAEKGLGPLDRLPKGGRRNGTSCPCGRAANVFVSNTWWSPEDEVDLPEWGEGTPPNAKPLPYSVCAFVREFDEGRLPQYDIYLPEEGAKK